MGFHSATVESLRKNATAAKQRADQLAADLVKSISDGLPLEIALQARATVAGWGEVFPGERYDASGVAVALCWRTGDIREVDDFGPATEINHLFLQGDTSKNPIVQTWIGYGHLRPPLTEIEKADHHFPFLLMRHTTTKCPLAMLPLYPCPILDEESEWVRSQALAMGKRAEFFLAKGQEILDLDLESDEASQRAKELDRAEKMIAGVVLPEQTMLSIGAVLGKFSDADAAHAPRGLLLHGPPGTGKTLIAKAMADAIPDAAFFSLSLPDLKQGYLGQSGQAVRELWQKIKAAGTSVVFIDECEGVFSRRGGVSSDVIQAEIVQAFLAEWDGLSSKDSPNKCLVVGATNRLDLIDEAIVSRFEQAAEVPLPDARARAFILRSEMGFPLPFAAAKVAEHTNGFSGRDLRTLAKQIADKAKEGFLTEREFSAVCQKIRGRSSDATEAKLTWDDLVLDEAAKENLQTTCSMLQHADVLTSQGLTLPRGLLLYGPPGTGKTLIGKVLAAESGMAFLSASTAEIKAGFTGQSGQKVKELFERARAQSPCILFIDEIDILTPCRSKGDSFTKEIVGQMLQELDGVRKQSGHVFILAATNCIEEVDAAILSRFPTRQIVPLPSEQERLAILNALLKGKPSAIKPETLDLIAANTEGSSGRDLRSLVEDAEKKAVRRAIQAGHPGAVFIEDADWNSVMELTGTQLTA